MIVIFNLTNFLEGKPYSGLKTLTNLFDDIFIDDMNSSEISRIKNHVNHALSYNNTSNEAEKTLDEIEKTLDEVEKALAELEKAYHLAEELKGDLRFDIQERLSFMVCLIHMKVNNFEYINYFCNEMMRRIKEGKRTSPNWIQLIFFPAALSSVMLGIQENNESLIQDAIHWAFEYEKRNYETNNDLKLISAWALMLLENDSNDYAQASKEIASKYN